jgi:hypothetical protein
MCPDEVCTAVTVERRRLQRHRRGAIRVYGLLVATEPDFWAPLVTQEQFTHDKGRISNRNGYWLIVAGRLGPESTR